jgi:hypothetical protein
MSWLAFGVATGGLLLGLIGTKLIDFADRWGGGAEMNQTTPRT